MKGKVTMRDRKDLILVSVLVGTLMSAIDTTIVILALPTITVDLHASLVSTIWVILIYLLLLAAFTTQLGRLGDIFGRGRMFNSGFLVFIVGSAASGASPTIDILIISRGIQAFGAALMQANSSAIVADNFPPSERGRAFGITTMGWNIGGTLGIVLGGIITTFIGWRYIFYINVPIGLIGFVLAVRYVKDNNRAPSKIDIPGMALLLSILSLISYGATDIAGHGVNSFNTVLVVAGLALIAPFIYVEKIVKFPVIEIKAFREPRLTFSLFAALLQALGYLSVIFILIMYLQGIRGFTPLTASLLLVPGYVVASLLAPRMGRLSDHIGAGLVAGIGIFLMAAGVLIYFTLKVNSSLYLVVLASIVSGIGGALFWPSNNSAVMSSAPRRLYGSISGLLRTLSSIGTLMSYVITISVASLAIPRYVAFEVFLGTNKQLTGGVSSQFLGGLHAALLISLVLLIFAGILSILKSGRKKGETFDPEKGEFKKKIDASPQGED